MIEINEDDISQVESLLDVKFDETRRQTIINFDDVQACPGSGKTTMVAAKLLIIAKKWKHTHQGVCVLTHTNVAKNEIVERLQKSPFGERLLSYPHFIGTIQEFVNKYLAIPYLRSAGFKVSTIDDDVCSVRGWNLLSYRTKSYLERKRITSLYGMEYQLIDGELILAVPGFSGKSTSASYQDIVSVKEKLMSAGLFYYGEMYSFAKHYLLCNPDIGNSVRSRFPIVLIDEMQDTQKFQDELLNELFLDDSVKLQRFGDPDQAIYSGVGEANETYNKAALDQIENSHRFDKSIASLARNLSFNRINLRSDITSPPQTLHTIFLVDEDSRVCALDKFAEICEIAVPPDSTNPIKTVGAVGLRKEDGLTICHYVDSYNKNHSTTSFKPSKFIHYIHESRKFSSLHEAYGLILEGVVKFGQTANSSLKFSDGSEERYNSSNVRRYLKDSGKHVDFNIIIRNLMKTDIGQEHWKQNVDDLRTILGLCDDDFMNYDNTSPTNERPVISNVITTEVNGRLIKNEVATIHSVKGETHAATLILETKNHQFDVGQIIEYILGENTTTPTGVRKSTFMKQLYVAFTRPKHLLCVAVDKSRFPVEHVRKEECAGWKIEDLTSN
ncbi:UvrD-helicase domain-containing protein [Aliagarivorans marinus]|uniref:UvrD-helicase domain-containing protein n=1 Tax=Aliagarivorans marinus TaxID=561965 RepID=UPI000420B87C|nr:UvrD-helicase domain-containing protein [Aliagarivorans marinus]